MAFVVSLVAGLIFGIGLIAAGMTNPMKVKGFLDLFGNWDPSLALVMAGAIAVGVVGFTLAKKRERSLTGEPMQLPNNTTIDGRLILGGILFGAGWGIAGLCPGPAITVAATGSIPVIVFVITMLVGMAIHDRLITR
ncbi:MAG: YeeE/YedE thiosulfate transporter family protein [Casimicrobiaceae bacterium]|nr:YeeE/YedE thiosulfate transporter family protein [Casimicrobiaceae bacterium]MCX8099466.1 YeeE/YedE thiosulfate transporter family protein [Casimicrobiaceae bacterium]MDW8312505.1 YeeE/YedE thiosulfate transporter family protein [Burkholderiales bacterium]